MDYRRSILEPGGSKVINLKKMNISIIKKNIFKDGNEMLLNFLGRTPNAEAFLKSKGLIL